MDLPDNVIAEIRANRKVTAIKLLRTHAGIGLKEAKDVVDAYADKLSPDLVPGTQDQGGGIGRILLLIVGVGVIFALYTYFT